VIALLDVNLLIALFDAAHVHHKAAQSWMTKNRSLGWATCPITQNGCVRVMSQPRYPGFLSGAEIVRRLAAAVAVEEHTFGLIPFPSAIRAASSLIGSSRQRL